MQVKYQSRWLAKPGNSDDEYEDALAPVHERHEQSIAEFRCAIADGASESTYAGAWARLLVNAFESGGFSDANSLREALPELQQIWHSSIDTSEFSWFSREKLKTGAFATFLGLSLQDVGADGVGRWRAVAVGDSCLFHVRDGILLGTFPITQKEEFGSYPDLLSSVLPNDDLESRCRIAESEWKPGDVFLLMTDALAYWSMSAVDSLSQLNIALGAAEGFGDVIDGFRKSESDVQPRLRDDDVTLISLSVELSENAVPNASAFS